jgi:hypothetical protein
MDHRIPLPGRDGTPAGHCTRSLPHCRGCGGFDQGALFLVFVCQLLCCGLRCFCAHLLQCGCCCCEVVWDEGLLSFLLDDMSSSFFKEITRGSRSVLTRTDVHSFDGTPLRAPAAVEANENSWRSRRVSRAFLEVGSLLSSGHILLTAASFWTGCARARKGSISVRSHVESPGRRRCC